MLETFIGKSDQSSNLHPYIYKVTVIIYLYSNKNNKSGCFWTYKYLLRLQVCLCLLYDALYFCGSLKACSCQSLLSLTYLPPRSTVWGFCGEGSSHWDASFGIKHFSVSYLHIQSELAQWFIYRFVLMHGLIEGHMCTAYHYYYKWIIYLHSYFIVKLLQSATASYSMPWHKDCINV